jgi:hypothetical protein
MILKYHTDSSIFYNKDGNLFPNPTQSLKELEMKYQEVITKYHEIGSVYLSDSNEFDRFDIELLRFNLCNIIENLEWKIDLKLLHQEFLESTCK